MDSQAEYLQDIRFLKIETGLGENALLLTGLEGTDNVSAPFLYELELATRLSDDQVLGLMGKPATIWFCQTANVAARPVNGMIRKLTGPFNYPYGFSGWRAELVPQLAFLAYTQNCRIFQSKTVVDIVTAILTQYGVRKFEFRSLMATYPAMDYCVQYRESALNFVNRLLEHYGIYYWFEHTETTHNMVLTDAPRVPKPLTSYTLQMTDQDQNAPITSLEADYAFRPGTWTLKDYDFVNPDSPLKSSTPTMIASAPMASYEIFDYPGFYNDSSHGDTLSKLRIEQEESQYHRMRGSSTLALFNPGTIATIAMPDATGHAEQKFFVAGVRHHATDMTHLSSSAAAPSYSNEFVVVPVTYTFRPERVTEKPFVQGPQTARVTGPSGQQVYTDKHARVKVRFHWDRNPDGNADEESSCWVRVSQASASGMGGSTHIPRMGEEVIVDFLEGDPDQPIITGRVYNGNNMTQFAFPANQTQSGFKTQSLPSGGSHELRFEDKAGSEEIYLHSQKDFNRKIENDESDTILGNAKRSITGTLDHTTTGNESRTISANFTKSVSGNEKRTISGTHTTNINGATEIVLGATHKHSTSSDENWIVGGGKTVSTTGKHAETIGGTHELTVTGDSKISSSGAITITAATKITIGVGGNTIVIDASGITVTASAQILMQAAMIEHNT
jgi:type VI secretion system secreted protein VgrG